MGTRIGRVSQVLSYDVKHDSNYRSDCNGRPKLPRAEKLTTDIKEIDKWQPGDIVIFGENTVHIGIISDKRNRQGEPYVLHNSGQPIRDEDILAKRNKKDPISGHYRWNIETLENKEEIIKLWED